MLLTYTVITDRFVAGGAGEVEAQIKEPYFPKTVIRGTTIESLDGSAIQTDVHAALREHIITTGLIPIAQLNKWREYEESTYATELHTFDYAGTIGNPDTPIQVYRVFNEWKPVKVGAKFFRVSFKLIEVG